MINGKLLYSNVNVSRFRKGFVFTFWNTLSQVYITL